MLIYRIISFNMLVCLDSSFPVKLLSVTSQSVCIMQQVTVVKVGVILPAICHELGLYRVFIYSVPLAILNST